MLEQSTAFAVLPASDIARATAFWTDIFGVSPSDTDDDAGIATYDFNGTRVLVYRTEFAGTA